MFVVTLLALKSEENKPEHVEGSQQRRGQPEGIERVSNFASAVFVLERAQQNRVLAEKSRKGRKTRDGQSGRQHRHVGPANLFAQPAHAVHVLLATHGMNHAARRQAEQRFEERMSHQVKKSRGKRTNTTR